jgi:hypothetical protein
MIFCSSVGYIIVYIQNYSSYFFKACRCYIKLFETVRSLVAGSEKFRLDLVAYSLRSKMLDSTLSKFKCI